jgi:hypothetical protein
MKWNKQYPYGIGPAGRWYIFAGLPLAISAIFFAISESHHALERAVGGKVYLYFLIGVPAIVVIGGMAVYSHVPQRLVVPLGIIGWIIHISVLGWFFWFGPGYTW